MAEEKKKIGYQSTWKDQIADVTKQIINREKFSYDVNGDALYKQYKDRYTQQGRQAMMDTMGQAQAMTGGYGNSYAQSVGQQTYQGYMQGLTDKIPTLYQIALDKYTNEGNQMRDNLNLMQQQENLDYGRFRDQVGDQQWQDTFDYGKARDEIADQQWRETFDYSKSRDQLADQQNAYSKLMALMTGYGYKPSAAEMKAAGMSEAQMKAILGLNEPQSVSGGGSRNGNPIVFDDHGLTEDEIEELQLKAGLTPTGKMDYATEKAYQKERAEVERKDKNRKQNTYNMLKAAENSW